MPNMRPSVLFLTPCSRPHTNVLARRFHRRDARRPPAYFVLRAGPPPPPKVKSAYYKNPSKAIEKGGGFYIPGLRGPRLRVVVSLLSLTLLSLNHLSAATAVSQRSLQVSELLAVAASVAVLATALADQAAYRAERNAAVLASAVEVPQRSVLRPREDDAVARAQLAVTEPVEWAVAVVMDLTKTKAIALCRGDRVVFAAGLASEGAVVGEAVRRVESERRVLYIDDSTTLPPQVSFPFLETGPWAVFLVPVGDDGDVVVFAAEGGKAALEKPDRAWLVQMAGRIAGGIRV